MSSADRGDAHLPRCPEGFRVVRDMPKPCRFQSFDGALKTIVSPPTHPTPPVPNTCAVAGTGGLESLRIAPALDAACIPSVMSFGVRVAQLIGRSRVSFPTGAAGEFSSREFAFCAGSNLVSVLPPCHRLAVARKRPRSFCPRC